jgi:uroporphyrinogen decarboxylase
MPEFVDHPVKCKDDWDKYKAERLEPDFEGRLVGLDEFVQYMQSVDAPVQFGLYPWGTLGTARDLMGAEEFLIGLYTQPDVIRDMMATFTDLWIRMCDAASEKIRIDHFHIWEDMCSRNGSLISMEMVEDFMMPHYDSIVALARSKQIPLISVDSDGLVEEIVPVVMGHGINVFFPFEVQAGNDILEYRRKYPKIGILYGLDKRAVAEDAEQEAIHRELDRAEEMLSYGGYVPGFDHGIPPNVPWKKFVYFVEHLRKIVGA